MHYTIIIKNFIRKIINNNMAEPQYCELWDKELCKRCIMYTGLSGYWGYGPYPHCLRLTAKQIEEAVEEARKRWASVTSGYNIKNNK
jgi:hypothetical protein